MVHFYPVRRQVARSFIKRRASYTFGWAEKSVAEDPGDGPETENTYSKKTNLLFSCGSPFYMAITLTLEKRRRCLIAQ